MQEHTSKNTSINSKQLPAVFKLIEKTRGYRDTDVLLDYGCGKYPQVAADYLYGKIAAYVPYDPYQEIGSLDMFKWKPATIGVLSNVINVIDNDHDVFVTIMKAKMRCRTLYITVYEGDKTGIGKQTKPDCWQANRTIKDWHRILEQRFMCRREGKAIVIESL